MKRLNKVFLLVFESSILFSAGVFAQDVDLDKIVVTPSRMEENYGSTSQVIDIFTNKDIEYAQSGDLSDILSFVNSVNINGNGGAGQTKNLRMRGSSAAQVLVLIDGRPVNSPRDGSMDLSELPVDNIAKMELVHGPGSSAYGSQAMAGTLNIVTKSPPKEKQKTEVFSSFGTFHTYNERFSHGARVFDLGYLISGGYQSSEGFRENIMFNQKDINAKIEYSLNDNNDLSFNGGFYKNRAGAPGNINSPDRDDKQVKLKNFLDFAWFLRPDELTEIKARIYNNYDRLEFNENSMDGPFDTGTGLFIHTTQARGFDSQVARKMSDFYRGVFGLNYIENLNDSTSTAKHKYTVMAGYLENQFELTDRMKFNLDVRVDDYSNFGTQASPGVGFIYSFNGNDKVRGALARSFRAPTFNDLYWNTPGMIGNPNVRPEKGLTEEIGVDKKINDRIFLSLNYYHSKYEELIQWGPVTSDPLSDWTVKNIGSAVIDGVELTNKINIIDNLEAVIDYSFMTAKDAKTHKFLIYQPKNKASLSIRRTELNGLFFEIKGQYVDKRFADSDNNAKVKQYYFFNVNISKKFRTGITYMFSINNVLNRKYEENRGYPVPGFSVTNGIKYEF